MTEGDHPAAAPSGVIGALRSHISRMGHAIRAGKPTTIAASISAMLVLGIGLFAGMLTPFTAEGAIAIALSATLLASLFLPLAAPMAAMALAMGATYLASAHEIRGGYTAPNSLMTIIVVTLIASGLMLGYLDYRKKLAAALPLAFTAAGFADIIYNNAVGKNVSGSLTTGLFAVVLLFISPWLLGCLIRQQLGIRKVAKKANELQQTTLQLKQAKRDHRLAEEIQDSVADKLRSITRLAETSTDSAGSVRAEISEESRKALNEVHRVINLLDEWQGMNDSGYAPGGALGTPDAPGTSSAPAAEGTEAASDRLLAANPALPWAAPTKTVQALEKTANNVIRWWKIQKAAQSTVRTAARHADRDMVYEPANGARHVHVDKFTAIIIAAGILLITASGFTDDPQVSPAETAFQVIISDLSLLSTSFLPTGGAMAGFAFSAVGALVPGVPRITVFMSAIASGILLGYSRRSEKWRITMCVVTTLALYACLAIQGSGGINTALTIVLMYVSPLLVGLFFRRQKNLDQTMRSNEQLLLKTAQLNKERRDRILAEAIHDSITNELSSIILLTNNPVKRWTQETADTVSRKADDALGNLGKVIDLLNGEDQPEDGHSLRTLDARIWLADRCAQQDSSLHSMGYTGVSAVRGDLGKDAEVDPDAVKKTDHLLTEIYANILRHAQAGVDSYVLVAELGSGTLRIMETNDCSRHAKALAGAAHGKGLELHRRSIEALGGTVETAEEDGSWVINCTIPLIHSEK